MGDADTGLSDRPSEVSLFLTGAPTSVVVRRTFLLIHNAEVRELEVAGWMWKQLKGESVTMFFFLASYHRRCYSFYVRGLVLRRQNEHSPSGLDLNNIWN